MRTFFVLLVLVFGSLVCEASENIAVPFDDSEIKAGDQQIQGDPFWGGEQDKDGIPQTDFLISNKKSKKTYVLRAPAGLSPELLTEYSKQKKVYYVDYDTVMAQIYQEFSFEKNRKFQALKGLTASEKTLIGNAADFSDLTEPLRKKVTKAYLDEMTDPIPLRPQPIGLLLNFVYFKAAGTSPAGKCACVKINNIDVQACDSK